MTPASTRQTAGFDFTGQMRNVSADMVRRLPRLAHIDLDRVAFRFCQTRKAVRHGLYASLTPLRFEGGERFTMRRGRRWALQKLLDEQQREMLYIVSFYLPRYLNLTLKEKLVTLVHELWHISPDFNGDLRRFTGRCYAHTGSQRNFDATVHRLTDEWLAGRPPEDLYAFLRHDFGELVRCHGSVHGTRISAPKLIPVESK